MNETVFQNATIAAFSILKNIYRKSLNQVVESIAENHDRDNYVSEMRKVIRELTENRLSTFNPETGKKMSMDLFFSNEFIAQALEKKLAGEENTGWEISVHFAPAEDHEDVQGKVFTHEDFERLQNHEAAKDIRGGIHQLDRAIGEWNCQHYPIPFMIGKDEPRYDAEELAEIKRLNHKGIEFEGKHYTLYEADQLHWRFEREIQKEKLKLIAYRKVQDTDQALKLEYSKSKKRIGVLARKYNELGKLYDPSRFS